jgi:hypothetical protein
MLEFEQGCDIVGKVAIFKVCEWFFLESPKERFLGVDPLGQHVPPHVRYETSCSLIRELWVYVSCSRATGKGMSISRIRLVQEGPSMEKP